MFVGAPERLVDDGDGKAFSCTDRRSGGTVALLAKLHLNSLIKLSKQFAVQFKP